MWLVRIALRRPYTMAVWHCSSSGRISIGMPWHTGSAAGRRNDYYSHFVARNTGNT